jgi:hypothetical protein
VLESCCFQRDRSCWVKSQRVTLLVLKATIMASSQQGIPAWYLNVFLAPMASCRAQCPYLDWLFTVTCVQIKSFRNLVDASQTIDRWISVIFAFTASILQTQDRHMSLLTLFGNSKCGGPLARSIPLRALRIWMLYGTGRSESKTIAKRCGFHRCCLVAVLPGLLTRRTFLCAVISVEGDGAVDILILDSLLKVGTRDSLLHQIVA